MQEVPSSIPGSHIIFPSCLTLSETEKQLFSRDFWLSLATYKKSTRNETADKLSSTYIVISILVWQTKREYAS